MDDPEVIIQLITAYPEFRTMYEQIYSLCRNIEGVMDMFSEELRIMDRNTVRLMIDEQQEEIEQLTADKEQLAASNELLLARIAQLEETLSQRS